MSRNRYFQFKLQIALELVRLPYWHPTTTNVVHFDWIGLNISNVHGSLMLNIVIELDGLKVDLI
jgi:hypothetical protein